MDMLVIEFMNSRGSHLQNNDHLNDPAWVSEFLKKRGLQLSEPYEASANEGLARLRALLCLMTLAFMNGENPTPEHIDSLNGILKKTPAVLRLAYRNADYRVIEEPVQRDWDWVQKEIAASFARAIASREIFRVRACMNPDCGWFFYDASKNRSRRWCDKACANVMNVRRFRERELVRDRSETEKQGGDLSSI